MMELKLSEYMKVSTIAGRLSVLLSQPELFSFYAVGTNTSVLPFVLFHILAS